MMTIEDIAKDLRDDDTAIQLLFAFNSVGKTRLSVAYKNATRNEDGKRTGIDYNAYSEDLFLWDNDIENDEANVRLNVLYSNLSRLHVTFDEGDVHEKLQPYRVSFDFRFIKYSDRDDEIRSISFFPAGMDPDKVPPMKISRGEERIFIWCFFLTLMENGDWMQTHSNHIFIDDPVTSLDDQNIFITASTIYDLIENHSDQTKIIISTHHVGMFSILFDWLKKGEKSTKYKNRTKANILSVKHGKVSMETHRKDVFLYHLRVLQVLQQAQREGDVRSYHFALLRQVLESVSSFLGVGRISYTLEQIGFTNQDEISRIVNTLAHKNVYYNDTDLPVSDHLELFEEILRKLTEQFEFVTHI